MRWLTFTVSGAILGTLCFVFLLTPNVLLAPIFVAGGVIAAVVESVRRRGPAGSSSPRGSGTIARASAAFVLVAGMAFAVFAALYGSLVAG